VLSASMDKTLRLWDTQTGKCRHIFRRLTDFRYTGWVFACASSPNERYVLSAPMDDTLRLWDVQTGKIQRIFYGHTGSVKSCKFSPDGRYVLSASFDSTLRLWDVQTGLCVRTFQGHTESVIACAFSPDGRYVLSASEDSTLRLWDAQTGKEIIHWTADGSLRCMDLSHSGQRVIVGDGNAAHFLTIVNIAFGPPPRKPPIFPLSPQRP
jgi:WD40 repeat protein